MNQIDARGYSCPEPVLMTKNALKKGLPLQVLVDSMTPVQNITRFATNAGYQVDCKSVGEDYELTITK
ncbi:sulfurtransferase TusA family protein [Pseudoflavonifractor phocaeensis]|uniref:sulfurtransferase TusA family protein n=1 Tax=Pseudoflavonifractor phocaeensis TaxID=1870988 RepID=UPI0019584B12|nr:sulfurtransferase TusA family protein [Pseudoflavonifractor phocaeensis]MBM6871274.1 sulfurtransferase TusA family protein [Pseudoflavonifractor phocaeensis]MBM6938377.1 sulfurtransferase TusA family protein [Pseudoflavonifractor phocaeensis]